jgi:hypothetical protein
MTLKNLAALKKEDFEAALGFIRPPYYVSFNAAENAAAFQRKQLKVRVMRPDLIVQPRGNLDSDGGD